MKEETIYKSLYWVNGSNLSKEVKAYDYDALGNAIAEKDYSFYGESLKNVAVTIWNREYDSTGRLIKEYFTPPKDSPYLYHVYFYTNGILTERKSYDYKQKWIYSDLYEFDEKENVRKVYLNNTSKKLRQELFYDSQKNLTMEKNYGELPPVFVDHTTRTYTYNPAGVLESQTDQDLRGQNYYYKHFYSSAFSHCDPIFTKVENLPSLKISKADFENRLAAALQSKGFPLKDNVITCKFIVTTNSGIEDLMVESGKVPNETLLNESILQLAGLWRPATQSGREVCAYVRLKLGFAGNKISIEIMQ